MYEYYISVKGATESPILWLFDCLAGLSRFVSVLMLTVCVFLFPLQYKHIQAMCLKAHTSFAG